MKKNYILFLFVAFFAWTIDAQVILSQSNDNSTVDAFATTCWNPGLGWYNDNSFYRAYNLADFSITDDFDITSVEYAQFQADEGKEVICNIYTASSDNLTTATLTLIQSATHISSATDDGTMISVPLSATIPAGSTIAFEVFAAGAGEELNQKFFMGQNSSGENDDSYLYAPVCGATGIVTTTSLGFPANYVMNVVGNILSVEEFSLSNNISIYPNPTSDIINIEVSNALTVRSLELYNIIGKQVIKSNKVTNLNLSQLNAGIYMLKVITDSGSLTKKIIKN